MKTILSNLLAALAVCLCAIVVWQWQRESALRRTLDDNDRRLRTAVEKSAGSEGEVAVLRQEISRLETLRSEVNCDIEEYGKQLRRTVADGETARRELSAHKTALAEANARIDEQNKTLTAMDKIIERQNAVQDSLNVRIQEQNAAIEAQNEAIEQQNQDMDRLVAERNDITERYNRLVGDYNAVAKQIEYLQGLEQQQEAPQEASQPEK